MKIPRYQAQSVVSELQAGRAALVSPGEAARNEIVKFGAIAGVAGSVSDALRVVEGVRKQARAADGAVEHKINENNLTAGYEALSNDPNLEKDIQDDGTTTSAYFEREAEALIKTYKEGIGRIQDPDVRRQAEKLIASKEQLLRVKISADAGVIESRIAGDKLYTGFNEAIRNGDIEGARNLIATGGEQGLLGVEDQEKWREVADDAAVRKEAFGYIRNIDEGFEISQDEGDARLSALVSDTSIDKEVRDLAIDGSEERAAEWGRTRAKEREAQEVNAILSYGDDNARASGGMLSTEEIDASYEAGKYGEGTGAASRRNALYSAVRSAMARTENKLNVGEAIQNGQFITNDTKSRTALSEYETGAVEGMQDDEAIRTIADISRIAGTVSTQTEQRLDLSAVSEAAAANALPLYRELTSDEGLHPDMHLNPSAASFLEDASTLMDAGVSQIEAITTAWANKNITETEKIERTITWKDEGVKSAETGYNDLIDSDWYEEPGFGDIDDPPPEMAIEYGQIFKSVYNTTGNLKAAKNIADQSMKKNWVMSNFSSSKPKEYALVKNGIPGDSRHIRKSVITELDNEKYRIRQSDGSIKTKSLDPEEIRFVPIKERPEVYDANGNQRFTVMHGDIPLTRVTDNGVETATITIDRSKVEAFKKASSERIEMEKRIKDIEREEKNITETLENNPYFTSARPKRTAKSRVRLTALGKERTKLKESLPAQVKF